MRLKSKINGLENSSKAISEDIRQNKEIRWNLHRGQAMSLSFSGAEAVTIHVTVFWEESEDETPEDPPTQYQKGRGGGNESENETRDLTPGKHSGMEFWICSARWNVEKLLYNKWRIYTQAQVHEGALVSTEPAQKW